MATAAEQIPREQMPMVRINEPDRGGKPPPLEMSCAGTSLDLPKTPTRKEKEKKIGHRRVDDTGQVTYKKKPTSELMAAIQLGIGQSITILSTKPKRDLLLQDFSVVELVFFPRLSREDLARRHSHQLLEGSNLTPAHHYSDFRFKTFAPIAFRYFRELFSIQPDDFLLSLCNHALRELSNPGASGSIFYITDDDEFIIKTVQHKESEFLQKLLPGYYMNLNQNPRTLLPKFYGLYCYQCGGKNIRFVVMNNLLPSSVRMHEKYDMKGSTYKRKASRKEKQKGSPTLKDLDFLENHPDGIMLEADTYNALVNTINRDCRVLQSFKIMDYSMLLGIHNLDQAARAREEEEHGEAGGASVEALATVCEPAGPKDRSDTHNTSISRAKSMRQRVAQYSTAMEAIAAPAEPLELDNEDIPPGGIPARNTKGERLLLYIGLIDILQNYRFQKRMEHAIKAMVHDGDTISVHRPGFYATRFQNFFSGKVFKKIPSSLKQSPSKKRAMTGATMAAGAPGRQRAVTTSDVDGGWGSRASGGGGGSGSYSAQTSLDFSQRSTHPRIGDDNDGGAALGATGGRPDLLPTNSTPPPTFAEALSDQRRSRISGHTPEMITTSPSFHHRGDSGGSGGGVGGGVNVLNSPAHSLAASTPTHTEYTEGTPSFTTSSPSCSSDMLDSLPSTTKSTRREFSSNGGTVTATTTVATAVSTTQRSTVERAAASAAATSASAGTVSHEESDVSLLPPSSAAAAAHAPTGGSDKAPLNNIIPPAEPSPDQSPQVAPGAAAGEGGAAPTTRREDGSEPDQQDSHN